MRRAWKRIGPGDQAALLILVAVVCGFVGFVYHRFNLTAAWSAVMAVLAAYAIGRILGRVHNGGPTD